MGRRPLSDSQVPEVPKYEIKVSVEFSGDLTTDCFRQAIQVCRAVDRDLIVVFNGLPVKVFPDSTVNHLKLTHGTNIELARLYGEVESLKKQLEEKGGNNG